MSRRQYGTRFTTGCGHSWRRRYFRLPVATLAGCTTNCPVCDALLIIPGGQFLGQRLDEPPAAVHAPLFHKYMHQHDPDWPEHGAGTGFVEFEAEL